MSLYTLFGITPSSHPSSIGTQYRARTQQLTPEAVEADFQRRGWGSPPPALVTAMRAYLYSSACLLSNPSSNEIYNAWLHRQPGVGERMRWFNKHATTPVFAMTANTPALERQACLDAGMQEVFGKPVEVESLTNALAFWSLKPPQ